MIWREGCFCSTYAANSPSESATLLLCLRPLYDFCNEITVCFPDQWVLLIVLATFLFSNSRCPLYAMYIQSSSIDKSQHL